MYCYKWSWLTVAELSIQWQARGSCLSRIDLPQVEMDKVWRFHINESTTKYGGLGIIINNTISQIMSGLKIKYNLKKYIVLSFWIQDESLNRSPQVEALYSMPIISCSVLIHHG